MFGRGGLGRMGHFCTSMDGPPVGIFALSFGNGKAPDLFGVRILEESGKDTDTRKNNNDNDNGNDDGGG